MNKLDKSSYARLPNNDENYSLFVWDKLANAIQSIGSYRSIVFDESLVQRVLFDMGRWIKFVQVLEKELSLSERTFERRSHFYLRQKPLCHSQQLTGLIDLTNTLHGYSFPPLIFYGEKLLALKVYQKGQALPDPKTLLLSQTWN